MPDRIIKATENHSELAKLAGSERFVSASLQAAGVAMWNICPDSGETWFSDIWYTLLGYEVGAFEPSFDAFLEMMHPDDRANTTEAFQALVEDRSDVYRADFRLRAADGSWRWIGATGSKFERLKEGQPYLVCGMQMDISWRKEIEQELARTADEAQEHKERLKVLADNSPASLFEFRMLANGTVCFPYITSGVLELLAVPQEDIDLDGAEIFRNIYEEDLPRIQQAIDASRRDLSPFYVRYRVKLPNGNLRWIQASSLPKRLADGATTWFGSLYEVTKEVEREFALAEARDAALALERQMRNLALLDGLTGLPNRRHFDEHLKERQEQTRLFESVPLAVLIRIDLDRFKNVNDTLGHEAGDAVLCHLAKILCDAAGPTGLPARTGGDEFSIILNQGRTVDDAKQIIKRIQQVLSAPFLFQGKVCRFGASFGVATTDDGTISSGDLMSFADAALYQAKQRGRNRCEVFDSDLHVAIIQSRRLAGEIEAGLENCEFEPFFQPQICARSGDLVGFEVLARWRSPAHGLLAPPRFLSVADQIRVVPLIDRMMIERATEVVAKWKLKGFVPPKLGFNVSAGRLREEGIARAAQKLQEEGIIVSFELLESILLEEEEEVIRHNLDLVRDCNIQLEVDDFGSGHASILGLLEVRPNILKIDHRLTRTVEENGASMELIHSVVGIAQALGIKTTVEGVETHSQLDLVRRLGCDFVQGYLFAKPMEPDSVLSWVADYQQSEHREAS